MSRTPFQRNTLFPVADHAHRGADFERELEAVHEYYLLCGIADIVKNPSSWIFCGHAEYNRLKEQNPGLVALDGNRRPMKRARSNVDFSGGNADLAFCFDAKQVKGKSLPLSNVHAHQVLRLRRSAKCGVVAGLMVKFSDVDRVFFLGAAQLEAKYEGWQKQTGKRAKVGTASIAIAELEEVGEEIAKIKVNGLWDWYSVLK